MQLMPLTAREMARKVGVAYTPDGLYDPATSVRLGAVYFRELLDRFDGNVELALASYNGGPNRIQRLWTEKGPNAQLADFLETLTSTSRATTSSASWCWPTAIASSIRPWADVC